MIITLHNLNTVPRPHYGTTHIYIGRNRSPFNYGNPFSHISQGTLARLYMPTRHDAVDAYRKWLAGDRDYRDLEPDRRKWILTQIRALAEQGEDLHLFCFCVPESCHGSVLAELIEKSCLTFVVQS